MIGFIIPAVTRRNGGVGKLFVGPASYTTAYTLRNQQLGTETVDLALTQVSTQYVDFANQCSMPAYRTLDARYTYAIKSLEFVLGVTNLADAKYFTQSYGCTAGVIQGIYPEAGRAVRAGLKLKF